jgi:hypothetical protein
VAGSSQHTQTGAIQSARKLIFVRPVRNDISGGFGIYSETADLADLEKLSREPQRQTVD